LRKGQRLDVALVERGLAASRERARALILAGQVRVDGQPVAKAGTSVTATATLTVDAPDHPYVGRGGIKLAHALQRLGVAVGGRMALDIGASTGGFTDVLLRAGARRVLALDVGHGQLAWSLRTDPRVTVLEGVNARTLTRDRLPAGLSDVDIVTVDVSFISLRHILPRLPPLLAPGADVLLLVKPQFEAGRDEVGTGGIVRDDAVHRRVVAEISQAAETLGFTPTGMVESPITGMEGNREFFLHMRRA
jgi:23S rRNA (cytidine1920-2'-O)/16S rRNA (cytidine1409-2'-O)-methyltransferase